MTIDNDVYTHVNTPVYPPAVCPLADLWPLTVHDDFYTVMLCECVCVIA